MSIYLCPSLQASLSAHTHHRKRACPSDRTGPCHSCSCSEVLLMSEVCIGFLSSSQLPSSVWASWWQNLYGFQSHTKPGVTSSSLIGFPIFWTQGLPCIIAKKETIVSHFSLFCFFFNWKKNFLRISFTGTIFTLSPSLLSPMRSSLVCPPIHYFLLLKLLLLYMYTYTHTHTHICVHIPSWVHLLLFICTDVWGWPLGAIRELVPGENW